jgi:hypothetical protein
MRVFKQRCDLDELGRDIRGFRDVVIVGHVSTMLDAPPTSITNYLEFDHILLDLGSVGSIAVPPGAELVRPMRDTRSWPRIGGTGSSAPQRRSDMAKDAAAKKAPAKAGADTKKSEAFERLLTREGGTSLEDLTAETGWQPHSCRAFLTGFRKKGWAIERKKREDGTTIWTGIAPALVDQA